MRIVILSAFYEPYMSGAEQMVKEIVERLGQKHEITLMTGRFSKELASSEKRPNFTLCRVGIGHKTLDKFLYPVLAAWQVRKSRPQIAHAIMESYAGLALVFVRIFSPQTKRILTLQSGDLDDPKKQSVWIRTVWKTIHRTPHHVTAISNFLAERAKRLGVKEQNLSLTPNGVDFSLVPRRVGTIPNQVVCVARLSWEKGLNYLLEAWAEVIKKMPEAKLVIVGEGNERAKLEGLIQTFNLAESVTLRGRLPHRETLEAVSRSEVFICPSLAEGLGIVFIEAQACGVPVIGTEVGGIPDVIQDGINGLLIPPADSSAISESIVRLLSFEALREKLIRNALETCQKYDWRHIISQIDGLYQSLYTKKQ